MAFIRLLSELLSKYQELKTFDTSLHQRTKKLISSLTAQGKTDQYLSLDSLMEVYEFLLELTQDVVKIITESKEDVWKNEELRSLVDLYFECTTKTLNLFNTMEKCVEKAETSQLIIQVAVERFETDLESMDTDDLGGNINNKKKNKYAKTLKELNKFKALGDPFGDEFATQYDSVCKQQTFLMDELCKLKVTKQKKSTVLSNVVFGAALVPGIFLFAVGAPLVKMVAIGYSLPIMLMKVLLKKADKTQEELFLLTENRTKVSNEAMETINILVEKIRERISSVLKTVDYDAVGDEEELATKLAMQEVMKKVEGFTEKIQEVGENVAKHSKRIVAGRNLVLEKMAKSKT